ncbi:MAG: pyridoxamine 5'-phosphate oxidase [Cyclobacteriaceae bacterium]
MELASIRKEYSQASLDKESADISPFKQFDKWMSEAVKAELNEPTAMVLSTSDSAGKINQRTVLLKEFNETGFVFYTNYSSRKAHQISENNQVSILFPWYTLERQVAVTGVASKISKAQSLKYFLSRPFGSQLGAWVSNQSKIISSRSILESKLAEMKRKFSEGKVPLPDDWGGYIIKPTTFEFWQGRQNRLHDRLLYTLSEDENWNIERLAP